MPEEFTLLNEWTKRLGLDDWFIALKTHVKSDDMTLKDSDGCIDYIETIKAARIQIVDPATRKDALRPFNFEETLVHELLHLKFCLIAEGGNWDNKLQLRVLHQIIDDLSRAFVKMKKAKHNKEL